MPRRFQSLQLSHFAVSPEEEATNANADDDSQRGVLTSPMHTQTFTCLVRIFHPFNPTTSPQTASSLLIMPRPSGLSANALI